MNGWKGSAPCLKEDKSNNESGRCDERVDEKSPGIWSRKGERTGRHSDS